MSRFQRLKNLRNVLYTKYLGVTNVCTTCGLLCLGDVLIQGAEVGYNRLRLRLRPSEQKVMDYQRTGRVFQVGIPSGIVNHFWYTNLDRWFPGRAKGFILRKVILDTALAGPCFLTIYFYGMALAEGKTYGESWQAVKSVFIPVYSADICYWPLMQAINFYLVPTQYRVLAISVCQLVWNSFLSFVKHFEKEKDKAGDAGYALNAEDETCTQEPSLVPADTNSLGLTNIKQRTTVSAGSP